MKKKPKRSVAEGFSFLIAIYLYNFMRERIDMIRTAVEADIPELMNIYNDAILHTTATFDTESKDMEERRAWFAEHTGRHILLVYETEGCVAGYASLSRYRDRRAFDVAVELSVYISEQYRGQGIGSRLMEAILSHARDCEEIQTVISLIASGNEASIHLHENFGFTYCGTIRDAGIKFGKKLSLHAYQIIYDRG